MHADVKRIESIDQLAEQLGPGMKEIQDVVGSFLQSSIGEQGGFDFLQLTQGVGMLPLLGFQHFLFNLRQALFGPMMFSIHQPIKTAVDATRFEANRIKLLAQANLFFLKR